MPFFDADIVLFTSALSLAIDCLLGTQRFGCTVHPRKLKALLHSPCEALSDPGTGGYKEKPKEPKWSSLNATAFFKISFE